MTRDTKPVCCERCRWWDTSTMHGAHKDRSPCRVNPPVADERDGLARWPYTDASDWCGHFQEPNGDF